MQDMHALTVEVIKNLGWRHDIRRAVWYWDVQEGGMDAHVDLAIPKVSLLQTV